MSILKRLVIFITAFSIVFGFVYITDKNGTWFNQAIVKADGDEGGELRGIWVATVFSLDFPYEVSADSEDLKLQLDRIVNNADEMGFNAIFFQVRPACDAFYNSSIFPTSQYLTGVQGMAAGGGFDPLQYIIEKAHGKNIQLHAWINPYRVTASKDGENSLSANNPVKLNPSLAVKHTDGKTYLNPALPEVRRLVVDGAIEIAKNYDVDGIHLDDYFYPDGGLRGDESYFESMGGGYSNIDDWRRDNVTNLIRELHSAIKAVDSDISFGVSPAGIWANAGEMAEGSDTNGSQTYFKQFADTRKWVKEGIIDYIAPQIYWSRDLRIASFDTLSKWWNDTVSGTGVKLYVGLAAYKADEEDDPSSSWYGDGGINELDAQINICRELENIDGYIAYRYKNALYNERLYKLFELKNTGTTEDADFPEESGEPVSTFEPTATLAPTAAPTDMVKPTGEPSLAPTERVDLYKPFEDMRGYEWAESAVENLVKAGVIKGVSSTEFMPSSRIKRADYALMITRMFGERAEFSENFADVSKDKYYYNEIGIARKLGFAQGMGDNKFYPENDISRQDMAVMAYRILKEKGIVVGFSDKSAFKDFDEVSDYARDAVLALNYLNALNGDDNKNVRPKDMASRADTAVFINNIYTLINQR